MVMQAMGLRAGKVIDTDEEWANLEWTDLFYYVQVNHSRLQLEGKLPKLIQRLNFLSGYEKVDPLSVSKRK